VWGGHEHVLRQTLIALTAGSSMSEHENPGEATLQVISGRVRLVSGRWHEQQVALAGLPVFCGPDRGSRRWSAKCS